MSAKKARPEYRTPVTSGMSRRDMAAALGISTAELHRYMRLAELPQGEFIGRMAASWAAGVKPSAQSLVAPVPARGRVQRAQALVRSMTASERQSFTEWLLHA
jgi:hypothetical protein